MKSRKRNIPILLGLLMIAAALLLTLYNIWDGARAEKSVRQTAGRLEALIPAPPEPQPEGTPPEEIMYPDYVLNPKMDMPEEEVDGVAYIGSLEIPALELELPVISRWSYPNLKLAPCRYEGSAYLDDLVIAAHNYESHFGRLKELSPGDEVTFTDMTGNVFRYEVAELETLAPTAIQEMTGSGYDLTLFTCTIGGKSRVTVRCDRVEDTP